MRKIATTLFVCAAVAIAAPAFAAGPDAPPPPPPPPGHCGPAGPGHGPMAAPALHLAGMLAAMESGVGVRASQIDAWRQYADAVQAVLPPPPPPPPGPASGAAFARSAAIAADLVDKAKKAEALLAAIENLRKTLTPEQLERAKLLEPHFPPHGGPLMPPPPPPLPR